MESFVRKRTAGIKLQKPGGFAIPICCYFLQQRKCSNTLTVPHTMTARNRGHSSGGTRCAFILGRQIDPADRCVKC